MRRFAGTLGGVSDGTRTRGRRDHNPELYQLSYAHQATPSLAAIRPLASVAARERETGRRPSAIASVAILCLNEPEVAIR
jgi:hypothetical protein